MGASFPKTMRQTIYSPVRQTIQALVKGWEEYHRGAFLDHTWLLDWDKDIMHIS